MDREIYNENFHKQREELTRYTAKKVINMLRQVYPIRSICDVGGGIGVWLDEAKKQMGGQFEYGYVLDGEYIRDNEKLVSQEEYIVTDLEEPFHLDMKFDLVISLEVAEHLSETRAGSFIKDVTSLGEVVLFSAAIPRQGGNGHLNEQPISYWKKLYEKNGYNAYDIIRCNIQADKNIPWWYRNNMMIYCHQNSKWCAAFEEVETQPMDDWVLLEAYTSKAKSLDTYLNSKTYQLVGKILDFYSGIFK